MDDESGDDNRDDMGDATYPADPAAAGPII